MPRLTRKPVILLPHKRTSGLFFSPAEREFVCDIKTDDGKRVLRKLGTDRQRAVTLFNGILAEMDDERQTRENPFVTDFLVDHFLPTQVRLKSYATFSEARIHAVVGFLEKEFPKLRIRDVTKWHGEQVKEHFADQSGRTINGNLSKFRQALDLACDMGIVEENPLGRVKLLRMDNRLWETLSMEQFIRVVHFFRSIPTTNFRSCLPTSKRAFDAGTSQEGEAYVCHSRIPDIRFCADNRVVHRCVVRVRLFADRNGQLRRAWRRASFGFLHLYPLGGMHSPSRTTS